MPFDEHTIDRHAPARHHAQPVACLNLREGDFTVSGIRKLTRNGRGEIQQGSNRASRPATCTQLEHLTEENKGNDHSCGFEVNRHLAAMPQRMGKKIRR